MNSKDVIYIDIEDDITAIIGKVKAAGNKVVALVPPKRAGVLQSAVNLKLLQKAAGSAQKNVVLVTNDHSLTALAAGVKMPIAKNLQSRPEVPTMEAPQTDAEEVIDGQNIPVGDLHDSLGKKPEVTKPDPETLEVGDAVLNAAKVENPVAKVAAKVKSRIPNFTKFRKRLFLFGGGGVLLVGFLVWAIFFAPHATVTITAKTSPVNIEKKLTMDSSVAATDTGKFLMKPNIQQVTKAEATEFTATGTKDIGAKATGTMTVRNCDYSDNFTMPAGTKFTGAGGKVFVTTKAAVVPQFSGSAATCTPSGPTSGKVDVAVEAAASGPDYNLAAQTYTVSGYTSGVTGAGTAMAGGTSNVVTVVSQDDVDKAKTQLPLPDNDAAKAELKKLFGTDQIVIDESFEVKTGDIVAAPNVGEQATKAKLTQNTVYTITGLSRNDISAILKAAIGDSLNSQPDQQAYSYGDDKITFQDYQRTNDKVTTTSLVTTGFIGPKINVDQLANQLSGKRYGEIQALVNDIPGVQNVTIDFSPFWVSQAPAASKIDIKFSIANGS